MEKHTNLKVSDEEIEKLCNECKDIDVDIIGLAKDVFKKSYFYGYENFYSNHEYRDEMSQLLAVVCTLYFGCENGVEIALDIISEKRKGVKQNA